MGIKQHRSAKMVAQPASNVFRLEPRPQASGALLSYFCSKTSFKKARTSACAFLAACSW